MARVLAGPLPSSRRSLLPSNADEEAIALCTDFETQSDLASATREPPFRMPWKGAATLLLFAGALLTGVVLLRAGMVGAAPIGRSPESNWVSEFGVQEKCRDVSRGDPCWSDIDWAMTTGIRMFPQKYDGLTATSSFESFQAQLHKMGIQDCPTPCRVPGADLAGGVMDQATARDVAEEQTLEVVGEMAAALDRQAVPHGGIEQRAHAWAAPTPAPAWVATPVVAPEPIVAPDNQEECKDAQEGDECYVAIIWALSTGVVEHPEWYEGMLFQYSGFSDGQAALHKLGKGNCPKPCIGAVSADEAIGAVGGAGAGVAGVNDALVEVLPTVPERPACKDATYEEDYDCFKSVLWAQVVGIYDRRDWYPGLTPDSSFGEFQADLFEKKVGNCTKPCNSGPQPKVKPTGDSLFCFSFVLPGSSEEQLVRFMLDKAAGIFTCDDYRVISTAHIHLGNLKGVDVVSVVNTEAASKKRDSWHNSELFASTWDFLMKDVRIMFRQDWIVKVDPDCVFFPDRLKAHIRQFSVPGARQYFTNCNWPAGASKLYGALEVFSREAIQAYDVGWQKCQWNGGWRNLGEDLYLQECLATLHVAKVGDFTLVGDERCDKAPCWDKSRASFHPYKDMGSFSTCYAQATR